MMSRIIVDPASASALLTDKECHSFSLRLDISNGNVKHSTAVFGKRNNLGHSLTSPSLIRGAKKLFCCNETLSLVGYDEVRRSKDCKKG